MCHINGPCNVMYFDLPWPLAMDGICRHEICQKFYTAGFSGKKITPLISPNFNSLGDKTPKKMSENGDIYTPSRQ